MATRKNLRSTNRQIEMLVDYMSTHTLFANGEYRGPLGKEGHNEEWVRIQQLLKEYGPNKTVEQWRTTWRDLKKKARHDAARANAARSQTGNSTTIPGLSETTEKILNIIGSESAYGMAGLSETLVGEITSLPSAFPSPPLPTTSNSPIPTTSVADQPSVPTTTTQPSVPTTRTQPPIPTTTTQPSVPTTRTQPPIPTSTMQPSVVPTTTTQSTRVQRAQRVKNEFLASDAETREVLLDISNSLKRKNYIEENQMRRNHLDRLHKLRRETNEKMSPKY